MISYVFFISFYGFINSMYNCTVCAILRLFVGIFIELWIKGVFFHFMFGFNRGNLHPDYVRFLWKVGGDVV
jgi:hypothetical protein